MQTHWHPDYRCQALNLVSVRPVSGVSCRGVYHLIWNSLPQLPRSPTFLLSYSHCLWQPFCESHSLSSHSPPPHHFSHGGSQYLLHRQHLLHLLCGGDCSSSTSRIPLVPTLRVPQPQGVRADRAPRGVIGLPGSGAHCGCTVHWQTPWRHPQPIQAPTTPACQELRWCLWGNGQEVLCEFSMKWNEDLFSISASTLQCFYILYIKSCLPL